MKPALILSEASDDGMPSDDDVPREAVICSTFSAAVALSSLFSLYFNTWQVNLQGSYTYIVKHCIL